MRSIILGFVVLLLGLGGASAARPLSNVTTMSFDRGHGTQIEYVASDGRSYLWYPGNAVILLGHWKADGGSKGHPGGICFRYGGNTYNPVTGHVGPGWECQAMASYRRALVEEVSGDVFGLAHRQRVPFVLSRERTSIARLKAGPAGVNARPQVHVGMTPVRPKNALDVPPHMSCADIIANQNKSRSYMIAAGLTYYHGIEMGKPCVKVDYKRAFALLRKAHDAADYASLVADLKSKASTGNPRAIAALHTIDLSPVR